MNFAKFLRTPFTKHIRTTASVRFKVKDTHRKKAVSNETPALAKSIEI